MQPGGSGFKFCSAFLLGPGTRHITSLGLFPPFRMAIITCFNHCDNGLVVMEDGVPISEVHMAGDVPQEVFSLVLSQSWSNATVQVNPLEL